MYEQAMTFADYVAAYQLARAEGIVLRYLADAYKTLRHTVPESTKSEDLHDLIEWLGEIVRQVDSSLVDEWEALTNPDAAAELEATADDTPPPVTANPRAFRVLVRNALFRRVELAAKDDVDALAELDADDALIFQELGLPATQEWDGAWSADDWDEALGEYYEQHEEILTGPDARGPKLLFVQEDERNSNQDRVWKVRQVIDDPEGDRDWMLRAEVDLAASDAAGRAVLRVLDFARLG
jgi:hypothetical protein